MDPFATLGIERRFDLDLAVVEKRHRELSRALHPDRYTDAGASERRAALNKAVEVNEAWRAVREPIRRAEALFALAGIAVGETREPRPSGAFLIETMELREELDEAKSKRDLAAIERLAGKVDERRRAAEETLRAGFAAASVTDDRGKLGPLVATLGELRFHRRFLDEVSAIEDAIAEAAVHGA